MTQLSHTGYLISQQITRGLPSIESIKSVIHDVYIRDKYFTCDFAIIQEQISHYITVFTESITQIQISSINNYAANPLELQTNPEFSRIKQQTDELFDHISQSYDTLKYQLTYYFQSSDIATIDLRERYLLYKIQQLIPIESIKQEYVEIIKKISSFIRGMGNKSSNLLLLPIDLGWLPQIQHNFYSRDSNLRSYVNPIIFHIYYLISNGLEIGDIVGSLKQSKFVMNEDPTILQYMAASSSNKMIDNVVLSNIISVIQLFHELASKVAVQRFADVSNKDYVEMILAVQW